MKQVLEEIITRSHNLIIEINNNATASMIVHQKNNILNLLYISEATAERKINKCKKSMKLQNISNLLKNVIADITKRRTNICIEALKDLQLLLRKVK